MEGVGFLVQLNFVLFLCVVACLTAGKNLSHFYSYDYIDLLNSYKFFNILNLFYKYYYPAWIKTVKQINVFGTYNRELTLCGCYCIEILSLNYI